MNHPTRSAIQAAIKALRECRELIQTDRTSLADSEMDPVTNTVPTDAKEMLDEYDSILAHAEDAVQLLTAALSEPEPEAAQVPQDIAMALRIAKEAQIFSGDHHHLGKLIYLDDLVWALNVLAAAPQPPAQAEACEMGPICIGCEPRGPRGECPGARAEVRPGFDVLVNAGALQMVRNALKRDADEGKQSRREMLAELEATIRPVQAQAEALGEAEPRVEFYTEDPIQSHSMSIAEAARVLAGFFNEFPGGLEEMRASQPMSREVMSQAARDVLAERQRQIEAEGWTPEHDDEHDAGELAAASAAYALNAADQLHPLSQGDGGNTQPVCWPWDARSWKPGNPRRDLVKSCALALAELERLDRASAHGSGSGSGSGEGVA